MRPRCGSWTRRNPGTGRYCNGTSQARAERQAYDADARRRLRELSRELLARAGAV
ncbi:hypothetical protein [Streptomyces sp. HPF1205]|uniref:hypothetical protein n=1 Tax=Streptomyces sp. HPF1205 TaxID=2873262 RepID=UPI001CEDE559|nr:hypothetical protein [Streptomyces sp. HPF1205]